MRIRFRWRAAYSLTSRFGLPSNRARRSETAATKQANAPRHAGGMEDNPPPHCPPGGRALVKAAGGMDAPAAVQRWLTGLEPATLGTTKLGQGFGAIGTISRRSRKHLFHQQLTPSHAFVAPVSFVADGREKGTDL